MKVVFFLQSLGMGGVERRVFQLAGRFVHRGHEVSVAALHTRDEDWKWLWGSSSVPVRVFFSKPPGSALDAGSQLIRAALTLRRVLNQEDSQLVYSTQWAISSFIAWLATRGMPRTKLIWNVAGSGRKASASGANWRVALLSGLCWRVSASVPLMISSSEAGYADRESKGYRCQRHVVIHDGIDVDEFQPDPEGRRRVRDEWAVADRQKLIGLVGRLDPVKGHPVFLKAASLLVKERDDVVFVCVGDGPQPYRSQLQQLSRELGLTGRLAWPGARGDMSAVYSAQDICCSSSYSEGFGLAIAEAMACGVPCVVTDVGDLRKTVGDTGIVVPPGDPHMLAKGLKTMLQRLHEVEPHGLRERIARYFTVETMVGATEKAMIELIQSTEAGSAAQPAR